MAERILLLPCSLPHFRFGFGPIIRPHLRMGPFFLARFGTCRQPVDLPICWTVCRCAYCIAVMPSGPLLTKRSKPIFKPSTGRRSVSSSLGPALVDTGSKPNPPPSATIHRSGANPPPLHPGHHLRFGFGPIIRLQPRLEPLFLPQ